MPEKETIVAPATSGGESAVALIRVSGPAVPTLTSDIFRRLPHPRQSTVGTYRDLRNTALDTLLYTLFEEGNSFTGEATLELMPHGNPWLVRKIVDDLLERGCRLAEPGAFTRQAFCNGRLDLTQAEAVMSLIQARSDHALHAAHRQLHGSVGNAIQSLVDQLLVAISQVEASIDFPEEDLPDDPTSPTLPILLSLLEAIDHLIATRPYASLLHEGVKCVILGEPNVGKSSLLNALTGEDRVLVSDLPGTTRDYIEERLQIGPHLLRIIDTAGLHETLDALEKQGIDRSLDQIESADLLLLVVDGSRPAPSLPPRVQARLAQQTCLLVLNKSDLPPHPTTNTFLPDCPRVAVSALHLSGLMALRDHIQSCIDTSIARPDAETVLVSARHADALRQARPALQEAADGLRKGIAAEWVAAHLRDALDHLEDILGKIDNERMLDKLFGEFCIGK